MTRYEGSREIAAQARPISHTGDIPEESDRGCSRESFHREDVKGDDEDVIVCQPQEEEPTGRSQGREHAAGLEDASWLKRVKTASSFLEELSALQPNNWLDWILDLQDLVEDLDIKDEQAIVAAAIQTKMEKSLRATIRFRCASARPNIVDLKLVLRAVCTTPEQMIIAERHLQGMKQGENEPLAEYLRRFSGWRFVAEHRSPTGSQQNEWKTRLLAGLNMYTGRLVDTEVYRLCLDETQDALVELAMENHWDGFTAYKRQPFILVNRPPALYQATPHQSQTRQVVKSCWNCGRPGHSASMCRVGRETTQSMPPREAERNAAGRYGVQ